jgi:hypothetical protein
MDNLKIVLCSVFSKQTKKEDDGKMKKKLLKKIETKEDAGDLREKGRRLVDGKFV